MIVHAGGYEVLLALSLPHVLKTTLIVTEVVAAPKKCVCVCVCVGRGSIMNGYAMVAKSYIS